MNDKRLDLQGLRAIAVLAVMVFHMNEEWLPGGYLGVDVFFVLSGYLMALVLSRHQKIGWNGIKAFYARRLARIVPAAFVVAAVTAPIVLFILLPFDMRDYSASLVGLITGTLNIMVANNIGYFSPLADVQPLLHYWSLMVELHFYLLIPLVYWLSVRFKWPLLLLVTLLFAISLGYANHRVYQAPNDAYYLLASRAWEFLAGVVLFLVGNHLKAEKWKTAMPWIGLVVVLWGFIFFDSNYSHPSLYTVPFILGVLLLMWMPSQHLLANVLSSRPLVYLGDISYSVYLWHNILIVLVMQKIGELQPLHAGAIFIVTLLLAHLTRIYIELPFLSKKKETKRIGGAVFYIPLILFFLVFGGYGFDSKGYVGFWKTHASDESVRAYELYMLGKQYKEVDVKSECIYRFGSVEKEYIDRIRNCKKQHGRGILVLGDSHSMGVFRALNWANIEGKIKAPFLLNLAKGSCGVTTADKKGCYFDQLMKNPEWIADNFEKVVYVQRGMRLLRKDDSGNGVLDKEKGKAILKFLSLLPKTVDVVWLGPRIEPNRYISRYVSEGCDYEVQADFKHVDKLKRLNNEIQNQLSMNAVSFVNGQSYNLEFYGDCDQLYWRDTDHWAEQGVKAESDILLQLLNLIGQK